MIGLTAVSTQSFAQQKTAKECRDEWRANKADNQAKGITEKAYVAQCRGGTASQPQAAPAAAPPATTAPAAAAPAAKSAGPAKTAPSAVGAPAGANQFASEGQAKAHCPTDTVVWANLDSRIYHFAGHKDYGNTKKGAFMCEKDTAAGGFRAAKNEKHP
ncbi:MAG TPA: hypothetical protein VEU47_05325 [Candidatus Cybelea sp.]|nr:hypothetical protein [Candidatus Cybelea sp.]